MLVRAHEHRRIAGTIGVQARLDEHAAAAHLHDRERMPVAVRVDTNDVVQLICKHPKLTSSQALGGTTPVSVWGLEPRAATL
jgi:hypothetical protein